MENKGNIKYIIESQNNNNIYDYMWFTMTEKTYCTKRIVKCCTETEDRRNTWYESINLSITYSLIL